MKTTKSSIILMLLLLFLFKLPELNAQIVNIPDFYFKTYLVGNALINTNNDSEIQLSEAQSFSGTINIDGMPFGTSNGNITDLTGIEEFSSLTVLSCVENEISTLDVSNNTALTHLSCGRNQISSLDVSNNTALTYLSCSRNQISTLDVSNNTALTYLSCSSNQLTTLNLSGHIALSHLDCDNNQLLNLDLNTNTLLESIDCSTNQLSSLSVKNGNNVNFNVFNASQNPNLSCIQVDDITFSNNNWINFIDSFASFSLDCNTNTIQLENKTNISIFPNPTTGKLTINLGKNFTQAVIEVSNLLGQIVFSQRHLTNHPIDLEINSEKGVYFVTVKTEEGKFTTKVLKE